MRLSDDQSRATNGERSTTARASSVAGGGSPGRAAPRSRRCQAIPVSTAKSLEMFLILAEIANAERKLTQSSDARTSGQRMTAQLPESSCSYGRGSGLRGGNPRAPAAQSSHFTEVVAAGQSHSFWRARAKACTNCSVIMAVDISNLSRSAHNQGTGNCAGITQPARSGENSQPSSPLWLERQGGFSGGTGVNQLDRMDALGLAPVLEENQSCLGKGAVAFRKRGLLNALCHGRGRS